MPKQTTNELISSNLYDTICERMILSGLLQHGSDIFYDIDASIKEADFFLPENKLIYSSIKNLICDKKLSKIDILSIIGDLSSVDKSAIERYQIYDYLSALSQDQILKANLVSFANRIAKLSLTRNLILRMQESVNDLKKISGDESLVDIINKAESGLVEFTNNLSFQGETDNLSENLLPFVQFTMSEQPLLGIPSGFSRYDRAIGGGFRSPGVHVIGGRAGSGKSFLCLNIAHNISKSNIPVLLLDTELTKTITLARWVGIITRTPINTIETGQFAEDNFLTLEINKQIKENSHRPLYYHNISGLHYQEWISIMRRWLLKYVGFGQDGQIKPCLIIIDYIKLMNLQHAGKYEEYQYLGQLITDLHNFCIRYNIAICAAAQLNREGIDKEDQGVFAGSDRIMGLCSSATILKNKQESDCASSPLTDGNKKLVIVKSRFGRGTLNGEYLNIKSNLEMGIMEEGPSNIESRTKQFRLVNSDNETIKI